MHLFVAVVVQFDPTSYSVDEGQSAVITVVSDRVSTRDVTVTVQAVDGTAVCKAKHKSLCAIIYHLIFYYYSLW